MCKSASCLLWPSIGYLHHDVQAHKVAARPFIHIMLNYAMAVHST